jgi:hypothetical protein
MAMNYEIPFARAQNQLHAAKISSEGDKIGKKRSIFWPYLADSLLNTNISSRISERFFKQISFHAKFTFSTMFEAATTHLLGHGHRRKYLCNFNTVKEKTYKPSLLCVPCQGNNNAIENTGRPTISFFMSYVLDHILRCSHTAVKKKLPD